MARIMSLQCGNIKIYNLIQFLIFLNILDTFYQTVQAIDGQTQGFFQAEGDLDYLTGDVSLKLQEPISSQTTKVSFTELEDDNYKLYESPVLFEPPSLDFKSRPVGIPHTEKVVIQNKSPEISVQLLSLSGTTLDIHCSFFLDKVIAPGGNTSFEVVLLARHESSVESTLFIHTSLGSFKYQVVAHGVANPYRLRPFLNVKMPLNSTYSPLVLMHNPHSSTLQVTDIYSSGGDLHLELPAGEAEASKALWEIPPYETKPVVRANFIARVERNHTSYIRIKTNSSRNDYLVIPVEVEVTSAPSIFSSLETLDYGVLRSVDESKTLTISLLNSANKPIHIANVIVTPVNEAVDINFKPLKVPPDTLWSTTIATATFNPSKVAHEKQCSGKIVIKSKNNQYKLILPYQVTLLKGYLDYNVSATKFYASSKVNLTYTRQINYTNFFNSTIIVHSVSLPKEARQHFSVNFSQPVVLESEQSSGSLWVFFHPSPGAHLTTYLQLNTNISHFRIPLLLFSGHLQLFLPHTLNQSAMDFGTVGIGERRSMKFALINDNPVEVNLKFWGSDINKATVELIAYDKGNASNLVWRQNFSASLSKSLILKPNHYAVFRVSITSPGREGLYAGEAFVETQYEVIKIPISLRTAKGSLKADEIVFENAFPGKISSANLYIQSTFSQPLSITSIRPVPQDPQFYFDSLQDVPLLQPEDRTYVGKVFFDPRKECKNKCYSGLPTTTSMGHQWLLGMALPPDIGDIDAQHFSALYARWEQTQRSVNLTLQLDTSEIRGFMLKARATLYWPRLAGKCSIRFPLTQIGSTSVREFSLENPSNLPVLVQLVPLGAYPKPQAALEFLSRRSCKDSATPSPSSRFTLEDLKEKDANKHNPVSAYRKSLEEYFGIQTHRSSIALLLTPGMRVLFQVGFTPLEQELQTSLLLIRNNLTVLEGILLQGHGGQGQILVGNKSPGSSLLFSITERHLKNCSPENKKNKPPSGLGFTVRRTFLAKNPGQLPLHIVGFDIDGEGSEGYGFSIVGCKSFELKPNSTKRIDIEFTPDFTLSHITRTLTIVTSHPNLHFSYSLVVTLPRHMLPLCSAAVPRPYWEHYLYLLVLAGTVSAFILNLLRAYLEYSQFLKLKLYTAVSSTFNTVPYRLLAEELDIKMCGRCSRADGPECFKKNDKILDRRKKVAPSESNHHQELGSKKSFHLNSGTCQNGGGRQKVFDHYQWDSLVNKYECKAGPDRGMKEPSRSWLSNRLLAWFQPARVPQEEKPVAQPREEHTTATAVLTTDPSPASKPHKEKTVKNNFLRNRFRNKMSESLSVAEEETSSTTTETSSNQDSDNWDKESPSLPDVCYAAAQATGMQLKKKPPKEEKAEEKAFVANKAKSPHRKHKPAPKSAESIDTHPSALELPYKPKPIGASRGASRMRHSQPKLKMPLPAPPLPSRGTQSESESSDLGKDSPPPVWDLPLTSSSPTCQVCPDEAMNQIIEQTEAFAASQNNYWPSQTSTYSAVVARRAQPAGRKPAAGAGGVVPPTLPGPIGQRPPTKSLPSPVSSSLMTLKDDLDISDILSSPTTSWSSAAATTPSEPPSSLYYNIFKFGNTFWNPNYSADSWGDSSEILGKSLGRWSSATADNASVSTSEVWPTAVLPPRPPAAVEREDNKEYELFGKVWLPPTADRESWSLFSSPPQD